MSSSNRHWPSMFKSKPSNNQFHHDLNFPNPRNSYSLDEERTPEPKPRWNPRPEQIRILEGIFNSGTVNPPRDEIRRIRAQLQEFGQVGDANVFYWFQNRKSRSKQKQQRHLHNTKRRTPTVVQASSSSSSDKSSTVCNSGEKPLSLTPFTFNNSPTASVSAATPVNEQPLLFPTCGAASTHGICFPDLSESSDLLGEVMGLNSNKQPQISFAAAAAAAAAAPPLPSSPSAPQGLVEATTTAPPKSTVFINDVCFEVASGQPFNVREAFGDDAVLVESSGQPVPTDEWGVTHHPLQHAAFYYLLRSFASPPHNNH